MAQSAIPDCDRPACRTWVSSARLRPKRVCCVVSRGSERCASEWDRHWSDGRSLHACRRRLGSAAVVPGAGAGRRRAEAQAAARAHRPLSPAAKATRSPRSTTGRSASPAACPKAPSCASRPRSPATSTTATNLRVLASRHAGRHRQRQGPALPQGHRHRHHPRRRVRALPDGREDPQHREAR